MLSLAASKKRTLDTLTSEKEPLPPPLTASTLQDTENDEILSSGSSSSDSSDSDSDSSSDSDSDSDSTLGFEFEEVSKEALDALLSKARENLRAKSEKSKGKQRAFNTEDDEIKLVESEDEAEKEQEDPARYVTLHQTFKPFEAYPPSNTSKILDLYPNLTRECLSKATSIMIPKTRGKVILKARMKLQEEDH